MADKNFTLYLSLIMVFSVIVVGLIIFMIIFFVKFNKNPVEVFVPKSATRNDGKMLILCCAFSKEYEQLKKAFDCYQETIENGILFATGTIQKTPCVLCMTGISPVNAARSIQWLIDHFGSKNPRNNLISAIAYFGIAGSLTDSLPINEVSCPDSWINYGQQLWVTENAPVPIIGQPFSYVPGFSCGSPANDPNRFILKTYKLSPDGNENYVTDYAVTPSLSSIAYRMQEILPYLKVGGIGISASIFLADSNFVQYLKKVISPNLVIVDEETASVAHVCSFYGIPYISFRMISDVETNRSRDSNLPTLDWNRLIETCTTFVKLMK